MSVVLDRPRVTDDRRTPLWLMRVLFGGESLAASKPYPGLCERVEWRVRELYRIPNPSMVAGSIVGGGARKRGETSEDSDPSALRDFLVTWLPERELARVGRRKEKQKRVLERDLLVLVHLANRTARDYLRVDPPQQGHVDDCLELVDHYLVFLDRKCHHTHTEPEDGFVRCRDCGLLMELVC